MSGAFIDNPEVHLETARDERSLVENDNTYSLKASSTDSPPKTTQETAVHFWYLNTESTSNATPEYTQSLGRVHAYTETVVNSVDGRREVDEKDYQNPDGKYRAIVKLSLLYEKQQEKLRDNEASWPMATGWLVKEDIVVTAGHCAYDHSHDLGRLVKVKAYVGYRGRKTVGDSERVEHQCGTAVATTSGWVNTVGGEEASDISLIKLSKPFKTVGKCFTWTQTPIAQTAAGLGVVGYPGDIRDDGERGARMYEMFRKTEYNLESSDLHMLDYRIDTYGGNSGSPVFNDQKSLTAIGVHVLGGYSRNSASVFGGPWDPKMQRIQIRKDRPWLWMLHETTTESEDKDPVRLGLVDTTGEAEKLVADIPGDILNADPSVLGLSFGPDAGPQISILASTAIAAAGRLAADSMNPSHAEALANSRPYDGIIGRAILAEAALQHHFKTKLSDEDRKKVTEFLGPVVASLKPFVMNVAPRILQGVLEPSMRLLLSHMVSESKLDNKDVRRRRSLIAEKDTGLGRKLDDKEAAFIEALLEKVGQPEAESFYSTLTTIGDVIGSAFKKAGPILNEAAKIGLPLLLGTESEVAETKTNLKPLAHRAILAEACLQAYVSLQDDLKLGEGGFFDAMATSVKNLGPKLVKVAPFMVKFVGPVVGGLLREMQDKKKENEKRKEFMDLNCGK